MRQTFADELLAASEDESLTEDELRSWMRRAALRLEKVDDPSAGVLERLDAINTTRFHKGLPALGLEAIMDDWSIAQGDVPFDEIDEDTETKGSA